MVKEFSNIFLDTEGLINWVKLVDYVSMRGKTDIDFPKMNKDGECGEYLKKKKEEKERLKEENREKEEFKKLMHGRRDAPRKM